MHGNGDVGKRSTAPALSVDWPVMAILRVDGKTTAAAQSCGRRQRKATATVAAAEIDISCAQEMVEWELKGYWFEVFGNGFQGNII
uniref:Uncharacterized protein n=1 Tax=Oryza glumipatula TaxID=40148 RepID=A0A0E0AIK0_9ORYZ